MIRKLSAAALGASLLFALAPAGAHLDPPMDPVIQVDVYLTAYAPTANQDDGFDDQAEMYFEYTVWHNNHNTPLGTSGTTPVLPYDWAPAPPGLGGGLRFVPAPGVLLYSHIECTPREDIDVLLVGWEDDTFPIPDDFLGAGLGLGLADGPNIIGTGGSTAQVTVVVTPVGRGCSGHGGHDAHEPHKALLPL